MAYLKQRGKKWYAVWREDGKKIVKSTKISVLGAKEKKLAQSTADAMEAAAKEIIHLETALDAVRAAAKLAGINIKQPTISEYLKNYMAVVNPKAAKCYKRPIALFLQFLKNDANKKINSLTTGSCIAFCREQLERISFGSVKYYINLIKAAFNAAVKEGILLKNPFAPISLSKLIPAGDKRATARLPFTINEMNRLLTEAPSPWRELVAISFFTGGQRLGDVACLKWESVDFENNKIRFKTSKTGRDISSPMVPFLRALLKSLHKQDNVYVLPDFANIYIKRTGWLSVQFTKLLQEMGIAEKNDEKLKEDRRNFSQKTFHSIRHTVVSLLRSSNKVSADLAREIVGHESEAVERAYFTPADEAKLTGLSYLYDSVKAGPTPPAQSPPTL